MSILNFTECISYFFLSNQWQTQVKPILILFIFFFPGNLYSVTIVCHWDISAKERSVYSTYSDLVLIWVSIPRNFHCYTFFFYHAFIVSVLSFIHSRRQTLIILGIIVLLLSPFLFSSDWQCLLEDTQVFIHKKAMTLLPGKLTGA